ncbi:hypothetical protein A2111_03440 [Candidatus Daviesbacteria bacterium GWA1_38_6]|nr:MAG: hypothetical protein A2111_03440 [Candidatus Daviesbacteria bacterium GWA1_38_6]
MFFILGLAYIISPGPNSIDDFPPIPGSVKSNEPGDTYQVGNIAAYFSDFDRNGITEFYKTAYQNMYFGFILPPVNLNYPPEFAKQAIRDEQKSTFLKEYVYPLKGSIFVNGYEPFIENELKNKSHNFIGDHIHINGRYFVSKTTIRYYPANIFAVIFVYFGIWITIYYLIKISRFAMKESL